MLKAILFKGVEWIELAQGSIGEWVLSSQ